MFIVCCWVVVGSYFYVGVMEGNLLFLYVGRFLIGVGVGLFSGVGFFYNVEFFLFEM